VLARAIETPAVRSRRDARRCARHALPFRVASGSTQADRILGTVAEPAIKSHLSMLQGIQQTRS
jgi:hypothetical protein